ncbi:MAG: LrgB family protein [Treponema sp.]|nr:LrgB family protein [Treponema sp.]
MSDMLHTVMRTCTETPFFGVVTCIVFYKISLVLQQKTKILLLNPLLTATVFIILFLKLCHIPYAHFKSGADILQSFLGPVTAILAIAMYNQRKVLVANLVPVLAGTVAGSAACIGTVIAMCRLLHVDERMLNSLLSKSVTTPIALALTESKGGVLPLTMLAVVLSGITGAVFAPGLVKVLHIKNKAAAGIAIGTCSHALGTTTALQMGEVYGAMSSIAIGCAGLATTVLCIFL